jgi:protein-S-isoprenylcysteine O-methyltransferase Ste14
MSSMPLAARAIGALLLLPGTMAVLLPLWVIAPWWDQTVFAAPAFVLVGPGAGLLLWCVWEFYRAGRGTLAPWSPPVHLVTSGPYTWSRNPMYVSMMTMLVGWAVAFGSWPLAAYAAFMLAAFHARIVLHEEPRQAKAFGAAWAAYVQHVPRWVGRRGSDL